METVPVTTRIRTSRTANIETERLIARLAFLGGHLRRSGEWAEQKSDYKARVREVIAIERELRARGEVFERVTRGAEI